MKTVVFLALVAFACALPSDDYSRYDNFNITEVINNHRLLLAYVNCFLGTGKCTPEGVDFKGWLPDAVQSSCGKCSEKEKSLIAKVIKATIEQLPAEWEKLKKIYDPDNKSDAELQDFLNKYGK